MVDARALHLRHLEFGDPEHPAVVAGRRVEGVCVLRQSEHEIHAGGVRPAVIADRGNDGLGNVADLFSVGVTDMGYASVAVLSTGRIVGVSYWGKSGSDADLYAWSWPASATAVTSGTVDGVGRLGKTFNTGTYAWVGSERDLAQYLNGDIAELIRYNRALTIDEVNLVGQYLAAKYAIAWAGL